MKISCLIQILFILYLQLRSDAKFNFIVCKMLGSYVNFRARQTAANKALSQEQINECCCDIWQHVNSFAGSSIFFIIMVLLRTDAKNYPLDVVLHPLFHKAHELLLRQQESRRSFPQVLTIILTVLFYKHWLQMCTTPKDRFEHKRWAKNAINSNHFERFERLPKNEMGKFRGFFRIDDRIYQTYKYNNTIMWVYLSFDFNVFAFVFPSQT